MQWRNEQYRAEAWAESGLQDARARDAVGAVIPVLEEGARPKFQQAFIQHPADCYARPNALARNWAASSGYGT
eukprot:scaffold1878_cov355-Prasinococcus_capsulatus_cf.AAC.7